MKKQFLLFSLFTIIFFDSRSQNYSTLIDSAREHYLKNDPEVALLYLDKASKADPENIEPFVLKSFCWELLEDNYMAIRVLDTAIHILPDDARLLLYRGQQRREVGDRYGALKDLDQSIQLDSMKAKAWSERSLVYRNMDKLSKSLENINRAIELDPASSEYYNARGFLNYFFLEKPAEAFADISKANQLKKPSADRSWEIMIDAARKAKMYDSSIYYARILLNRKADNYSILWKIARAHADAGRHDSALYYFDSAIAIRPLSGMYLHRAGVNQTKKEYSLAINDLNKAIAKDSLFGEAYIQRALVKLEGYKDIEGALADYSHILRLKPEFGKAYYQRALLWMNYQQDLQRACVDMQNAISNGYLPEQGEMEKVCERAGAVSN